MTKNPCSHKELFKRIKIPVNQYVCGDCKGKLLVVIPQYLVMPPEEFEDFKRKQNEAVLAAKRQQETGLVTPDEARQMQAKAKEGKR